MKKLLKRRYVFKPLLSIHSVDTNTNNCWECDRPIWLCELIEFWGPVVSGAVEGFAIGAVLGFLLWASQTLLEWASN